MGSINSTNFRSPYYRHSYNCRPVNVDYSAMPLGYGQNCCSSMCNYGQYYTVNTPVSVQAPVPMPVPMPMPVPTPVPVPVSVPTPVPVQTSQQLVTVPCVPVVNCVPVSMQPYQIPVRVAVPPPPPPPPVPVVVPQLTWVQPPAQQGPSYRDYVITKYAPSVPVMNTYSPTSMANYSYNNSGLTSYGMNSANY